MGTPEKKQNKAKKQNRRDSRTNAVSRVQSCWRKRKDQVLTRKRSSSFVGQELPQVRDRAEEYQKTTRNEIISEGKYQT